MIIRVFPEKETEADTSFYKKCRVLDWVNYDHLDIVPRNRCDEMWEYAANSNKSLSFKALVFNMMDNRMTPLEKLECMVECFKIITQVLELASSKEGGGGADDTLPILIYVMLRACPRRMHSNLK